MDASTTLVTFMYQNLKAHQVELLGSWDNFSKPYRMALDSRRGGDQWTGCYRFDDIKFDGDMSPTSERRSGGLKMGGTYWYYYSIDGGAIETFNAAEPYTTSCPLMPGQCVNVLEVPSDCSEAVDRHRPSASAKAAHTLDPEDRYVNPRPPPAPKPHLPPLITPSLDSASANMTRPKLFANKSCPASADGCLTERSPLSRLLGNERRAKSADSPPAAAIRSALSLLKEAQAAYPALSPTNGSEGPSRSELQDHNFTDRSLSAGKKFKISRPMPLQQPEQDRGPAWLSQSPLSLSPIQDDEPSERLCSRTAASNPRLDGSRRRTRSDEYAHRHQRSDQPRTSPTNAQALQERGRSASAERLSGRGIWTAPSAYRNLSPASSSRSSSKKREPSTLGLSTAFEDADWSPLKWTGQTHQAFEFLPKFSDDTARPVSRHGGAESRRDELPSKGNSKGLSLDKELPPLPSYLFPSPLRVRPAPPPAAPSSPPPPPPPPRQPFVEQGPAVRSHFSLWSTLSRDVGESTPESESEDEFDLEHTIAQSPGICSDAGHGTKMCTSHRLSCQTAPSLDLDFDADDPFEGFDGQVMTPTDGEGLRTDFTVGRTRNAAGMPENLLHNPYISPLLSRSCEILEREERSSFPDPAPTGSVKQHMPFPLPGNGNIDSNAFILGKSHPEQFLHQQDATGVDALANEFDYLGRML